MRATCYLRIAKKKRYGTFGFNATSKQSAMPLLASDGRTALPTACVKLNLILPNGLFEAGEEVTVHVTRRAPGVVVEGDLLP